MKKKDLSNSLALYKKKKDLSNSLALYIYIYIYTGHWPRG